ncbi:MAG: double zinc ribbon domain-containing protein [Oscillospiraceae bacterium]
MSNFVDFVAHIFFPNKCLACRKAIEYDELFCDECCKIIPVNNAKYCPICGKNRQECCCKANNLTDLNGLISPFFYETGIKNAIIDLKFNNNRFNARKLSIILQNSLFQSGLINDIDLIIPVPMFKKDVKTRGYNQSVLLAKWLSYQTKIPYNSDILIKIKQTLKQHNLSAKGRKINLIDAFSINNFQLIKSKNLLLLDDVFTTGTTMNLCAKMLLNAGSNKVFGMTVAKTKLEQ